MPASLTGSIAKSTTGAISTLALVCTMPAGIVAGEGLLAVTSWDGAGNLSTASAGWVKLGQRNNSGAGLQHAAFWKIAAGGDTLTIDSSVSERGTALIQRVIGHDLVLAPFWAGSDNGATAGANVGDPPSLNPGVGVNGWFWIAALAMEAAIAATAAPTNYGGFDGQIGAGSGAGTYWATRALAAASEDPGVFTHPSSAWAASTIAIPPTSIRKATINVRSVAVIQSAMR